MVIWYLTKPALQSMGCTSKATKESFVVPSQAGLIPEAGVCGRALHHIFPDVADVKSHLQMFPDVPSFRIPSGNLKWLKKLPTASRGYSKRTCKNNLHRTYRNRFFFSQGQVIEITQGPLSQQLIQTTHFCVSSGTISGQTQPGFSLARRISTRLSCGF